ncbi:NAD-dependent epimerase/dehydratase family protein [Sulfurimonas microaerophilic]|uniref:NAD-dependent epimerase/dehydratase family protein n=1 Tax=Sulfurimonas microaerophilic TaxID=3058392 RepID=UPI00271536E6|nr:NAD-dependent epimerase/dehydratase [Sulfurimonas sp. hsl 1-7]
MTVLLTGSTGFLGSYLLKYFVNAGYKVIALKRTTSDTYRIDKYLDRVTTYNVDTINVNMIFNKHQIDIVINTVTNYGRKDTNISSIIDTNLMFGLKVLEASIDARVRAFINTDTLLERNINTYSLSKAQLVDWMQFLSNKNTKIINVKIEHMYGPLDDENKFIYWLINQLKQNIDQIDLTSGIQKRDFIYIEDIVSAYNTIIENIEKLSNYEEFELGAGESIEVKTFIEKIYSELSNKQSLSTKLNFGAIAYRENENMNMIANIEKLKQLGWAPKTSIENGIKNILNGES